MVTVVCPPRGRGLQGWVHQVVVAHSSPGTLRLLEQRKYEKTRKENPKVWDASKT